MKGARVERAFFMAVENTGSSATCIENVAPPNKKLRGNYGSRINGPVMAGLSYAWACSSHMKTSCGATLIVSLLDQPFRGGGRAASASPFAHPSVCGLMLS